MRLALVAFLLTSGCAASPRCLTRLVPTYGCESGILRDARHREQIHCADGSAPTRGTMPIAVCRT